MTDPRDLQLTALEKAETALSLLRSIRLHDQALITRQPANAFKDAERSVLAGVETLRREAKPAPNC